MIPEAAIPDGPDGLLLKALDQVAKGLDVLMHVTGRTRPEVVEIDRRLRVRIAERRVEADDVVSLEFAPQDRETLPAWDPGAHVDVTLPSGSLRQYSLTGDPDDLRSYRIAVRRIPEEFGGGGGSIEVHGLSVGDELVLKGPRNAFPFINAARYLFVAGGIGITPILPMVRDAVARGDDWAFVYCGRTRDSMAFGDEIAALAERFPDRVHVWPDDEVGTPSGDRIVALAPPGAALYCCGPILLIDAIRAAMPAENVDTLHYERFSAPPVVGGEPFVIELPSGERVDVAADQSALTALKAVRPSVAYSCQQGFCGTCRVRVLAGEVEHHDQFLTPEQRVSEMAICVSRGRGTVSLEL